MLKIEGVSKSFGNVRALHDVSVEFTPGEIHGVLGENGAGKSTLMSVLAGFVVPDSGCVVFADSGQEGGEREVPFGRPHEVRAMGIEMVHQHFMLVPEFSVEENFALGTLDGLRGLHDTEDVKDRLNAVAKELGWEVDSGKKTRSLAVGVQQRLEILKSLAGDAQYLILDEPTAVLSPTEVEDLFRVLRRLRDNGKCVVLIAHKLSEVLSVTDNVSVLRRGELVATAKTTDVDEKTLTEWMVGEVPALRSPLQPSSLEVQVTVNELSVRGDRGEDAVRGVSFDVHRGEVLGIGGVDGNGQLELAEALAGLRSYDGQISGAENQGYVPQDRHGQGLALGMSVSDNFLIGAGGVWRGPMLLSAKHRERARSLVSDYQIKVSALGDTVRTLSGGNQQKLVVSRVLSGEPEFLIVHNPTRGLDVKATAYVQERIIEAARNGAAVLLISTDLDELSALASRTLFINRGVLIEGGAEAMVT